MSLNKPLKIERMAAAGIMLTKDEVKQLGNVSSEPSSPEAVQDILGNIVAVAKEVGHEACNRADCLLSCAAVDLSKTVSDYGTDLVARCTVPSCDDVGVLVAQEVMVSLIPEHITEGL